MKVLLLYPNLFGMNMLPPSIALMYTLLKQKGHEVELFDSTNYRIPGEEGFNSDKVKEQNLNVRPFDDTLLQEGVKTTDVYQDFREKVRAFNPGLIAMSCTEDIFPVGIGILQHVNDLDIPVIAGGVFPTFAPELTLSYPEIDMVCKGEGEYSFIELCDRMDQGKRYDNIPGIWIRKPKWGIIRNPMGPIVNVNDVPLLDFSLFEDSRFYRPMQGKLRRMMPIETHRGCPYTCSFCNSPSQNTLFKAETGESFFRKRQFDKVKAELEHYIKAYQADSFYFWADTFFAYSDREFNEFCEMYSDIKRPFWCQTRAETVTVNRLQKLKDVGLMRMAFGVEHGNPEFRRRVVSRNLSNQCMIDAFKIVNKVGVPYSLNNIMGFPTETRALAMETIELNRHFNADSVNAYTFSPFHGTPLRDMAEKLGFIKPGVIVRSCTKTSMLDMPEFPPDAIEGLRRCFVMYVKMPAKYWPQIEKAEAMTPEGNRIWQDLRNECAEKYMHWTDSDGESVVENHAV
jgi:anaerobic magnesium-protoporphyrin IX monomethyl ester cyclase